MAKNPTFMLAGILLSATTGCAFFEQPLSDLPDLTQVSAENTGDSQQPAAPLPTPQTGSNQPAPPAGTATSAAPGATSYLVVAPIENLPEDALNIAVIHFTKNDTRRALALCKVLTDNLQISEVQDLPAQATNVALWPVANDNAGGNCIEMMTDYEPIDITVEAAKKVNDSAEGPFLLTQHMSSGKRMIYDMSFVSQTAIKSAVGEWQSLMGSDPANWPDYRRAR